MNKHPAKVCVIGAGIIGSWTALHLREAGASVTLIEQFPLPHTRGSSHGMSRAFRLLGELELDRLDYSFERWQGLEKEIDEILFVKTGLLNFGPPGDEDLAKFMGVLDAGGRPYEWLDSASIASRYPTLNYPGEWGAAWDPNGGILLAHRCLDAVQSRFRALGGEIFSQRVVALNSNTVGGVEVGLRSDTSGEESLFSFDQAVVCAGPWTGRLVPELEKLLHSLATPVTYWRDPSGLHQAAKGFPILFNARLTGIYGIPSCEYHGLVKMLYHGGPESHPDTRDTASCAPYIEEVRAYVEKYLPELDSREPAIAETCMYTMTPDSVPVIDRVSGNIVVGCGFSGSGFKHSPATGHMLAALALDQQDSIPTGFRADRYLLDRF